MRSVFLISMFVGFLCTVTAFAGPLDKVHPSLQARMMAAGEGELIPVMIDLHERFDVQAFMERTAKLSKKERRAQLIKEASAFADERQAEILARLEGAVNVRGLWIVNMVTADLDKATISELAAVESVSMISWDRPFSPEMLDDAADEGGGGDGPGQVSWSVEKINAPSCWRLGALGQGVVISNLDSGTDYNHPDLSDHIWNNVDEIPNNGVDDDSNGYIDDTKGWDFDSNDKDPMDQYGHGTKTAGVSCGDGTNGTSTGVAPEALLMICRIGSEGDHISAQEYSIENGADVITSSYSFKWYFSPRPDYHRFRDASVMEMAAGLFHNNSSSNDGSSVGKPWNISAPANVPPPWIHPEEPEQNGQVAGTLGVGGTESDDTHYSPSPIGPSAWEDLKQYDAGYPHTQNPAYWDYPYKGGKPGIMKVDVCCPTGGVPSTEIGGGYTQTFSGTSAATPHSGGSSCVLLSANPSLTPDEIAKAIKMNAVDLGTAGLDDTFGAGRMDLYEAVINVFTTLRADDETPDQGTTVTLDMEGPAGAQYALLFSPFLGTTTIPGYVTIDIAPPYLWLQIANYDGVGHDDFSFFVPVNPVYSGVQLHFQSITNDSAGATGLFLASLHETVTIQ